MSASNTSSALAQQLRAMAKRDKREVDPKKGATPRIAARSSFLFEREQVRVASSSLRKLLCADHALSSDDGRLLICQQKLCMHWVSQA